MTVKDKRMRDEKDEVMMHMIGERCKDHDWQREFKER